MKIACPTCGMHFDVDSGSLDRYFRCTECKTLFLGLNAKSVKEPQYVVKEDDAEDTDLPVDESISGDLAAADAAASALDEEKKSDEVGLKTVFLSPASEEAISDAGKSALVGDDSDDSSADPVQGVIEITFRQIAGAAAIVLLLIIIIGAVTISRAHSRIADLRKSVEELNYSVKQLEERLNAQSEAADEAKDTSR